MPPPNDNFANAQVIVGYGTVGGNNLEATVEPGEGGTGGKTVWYRWTPPQPVAPNYTVWPVFFATLRSVAANAFQPTRHALRSSVRAYYVDPELPGTGIQQLREVTYIEAWTQRYSNWWTGSMISFTPEVIGGISGSLIFRDYYVRVDGVSGDEGYFTLNFDRFSNFRLGACNECPPDIFPGETCVGQVEVNTRDHQPDFTNGKKFSFGSQVQGNYIIHYCGGSWKHWGGPTGWVVDKATEWPLSNPPGPNTENHYIEFLYNDGVTAEKQVQTINPVTPGEPGGHSFRNPEAAEDWARCEATPVIQHTGGEIKARFFDPNTSDNEPAPNGFPVFGLSLVQPVFVIRDVNTSNLSGNRVRMAVDILNKTRTSWLFTATLQPGGGVANPNGPFLIPLAPFATTVMVFDFDLSPTGNTNVTATITMSDGFSTYQPFVINLTPILSIEVRQVLNVQCAAGTGFPNQWTKRLALRVTNKGYLATRSLFFQFPGAAAVATDTCVNVTSTGIQPNGLPPGQGSGGLVGPEGGFRDFIVKIPMNSPCPTQITFRPVDGPYTHPDIIVPVEPVASPGNFSFTANAANKVTFLGPSEFISSWSWDFGDGTTSTLQSPVKQYNSCTGGTFNVTLTMVTTCGQNVVRTQTLILPPPGLIADFTIFSNAPNNFVSVTDASSGPTYTRRVEWGDGTFTDPAGPTNVQHVYAANGTYAIKYIITDVCGRTVFTTKNVTV